MTFYLNNNAYNSLPEALYYLEKESPDVWDIRWEEFLENSYSNSELVDLFTNNACGDALRILEDQYRFVQYRTALNYFCEKDWQGLEEDFKILVKEI